MPRLTAQKKLAPSKEAIIHGYSSGISLRDLAELYQAKPSSLYRFLISNGVTMRRRGRPKKENKNGDHE